MEDLLSPPKRLMVGPLGLEADLALPQQARGLVVFAQATGHIRRSPAFLQMAQALHEQDLGTLLFDLLLPAEAQDPAQESDIALLAQRLLQTLDWLDRRAAWAALPVGVFAAGTGTAAALAAASQCPRRVSALVSRAGRPELAGPSLDKTKVPALMFVSAKDAAAVAAHRDAIGRLPRSSRLVEVPKASPMLNEPAVAERVAQQAAEWFASHLPRPVRRAA